MIYTGILTRVLINLCILVQDSDGGLYGGILRGVIPRLSGGGVTQEYPLSLTIFNVVVESVVRH